MKHENTRARLLSLLTEACELEHGLACCYLFAAFSIKRDISEGISWEEQQNSRRWASQIYHVAAQEMLHLAQAWNLLTAIGGSPYYFRPGFPCPAKHYPFNIALSLRRFDSVTMNQFVLFEMPEDMAAPNPDVKPPPGSLWPIDETFAYNSVGELYGECLEIIENVDMKTLFIGKDDRQIGEKLIDFPEIVNVHDVESAREAIDMITEQGEGNPSNHEDSHYGIFKAIADEISVLSEDGAAFSRPVGPNPFIPFRRDQMTVVDPKVAAQIGSTKVTDEVAIASMDLFDDVYVSMLQAMAYVFCNATTDPDTLKLFAESSLQLMITVIKPLGEAVCLLPSGVEGKNAGPSFSLSRHTSLPPRPEAAKLVYHERLKQTAAHAEKLLNRIGSYPQLAQDQLRSASVNLKRISAGQLGR